MRILTMNEKDIYDSIMKAIPSVTCYNRTLPPPKDFEVIKPNESLLR